MDIGGLSVDAPLEKAPAQFHAGTALLLVDPQNAFLHPDGSMSQLGLPTERIHATLDILTSLLQEARAAGLPIFVLQMWVDDYDDAGLLMEQFPPLRALKHCAADTWDAAFADQISIAPADTVIRHERFSGFHATELEAKLSAQGIDTLILAGFATNAALESTARSAFDRDIHVYIPSEATASYTEEMEKASLLNLSLGFAKIVPIESVLAGLRLTAKTSTSPAPLG
ncbi:MAG: cysteine hydrolase [bacterium]|nr:cysteine hydrolase [bacterium]